MSWFKKKKSKDGTADYYADQGDNGNNVNLEHSYGESSEETEPHITEREIPKSSNKVYVYRNDYSGIYIIQDNNNSIEFTSYNKHRTLRERVLLKKNVILRATIERAQNEPVLYNGMIETADGQNFVIYNMEYIDAQSFYIFMHTNLEQKVPLSLMERAKQNEAPKKAAAAIKKAIQRNKNKTTVSTSSTNSVKSSNISINTKDDKTKDKSKDKSKDKMNSKSSPIAVSFPVSKNIPAAIHGAESPKKSGTKKLSKAKKATKSNKNKVLDKEKLLEKPSMYPSLSNLSISNLQTTNLASPSKPVPFQPVTQQSVHNRPFYNDDPFDPRSYAQIGSTQSNLGSRYYPYQAQPTRQQSGHEPQPHLQRPQLQPPPPLRPPPSYQHFQRQPETLQDGPAKVEEPKKEEPVSLIDIPLISETTPSTEQSSGNQTSVSDLFDIDNRHNNLEMLLPSPPQYAFPTNEEEQKKTEPVQSSQDRGKYMILA